MNVKGFLFDLDGVFHISQKLIDGGNETIEWLIKKNIPYRFLTNTTTMSRLKLANKLSSYGLNISANEIISANYAGVLHLRSLKAKTCMLILNKDAKDDYFEFNIDNNAPEYIVIGDIEHKWNYTLMNELFNLIFNGSKIIALHKGRYYQTEAGLQIDSGAFIQGLEYATESKSTVIGKPKKDFFDLAIKDLGISKKNVAMVGDDLVNDIQGAKDSGILSILVKTGKFRQEILNNSTIIPDYLINSIHELPIIYNKYLNL